MKTKIISGKKVIISLLALTMLALMIPGLTLTASAASGNPDTTVTESTEVNVTIVFVHVAENGKWTEKTITLSVPSGSTMNDTIEQAKAHEEYDTIIHEAGRGFTGWGDIDGEESVFDGKVEYTNAEYEHVKVKAIAYYYGEQGNRMSKTIEFFVPKGLTIDDAMARFHELDEVKAISHEAGRSFTGWKNISGNEGTAQITEDIQLWIESVYANVKIPIYFQYDDVNGDMVYAEQIACYVPKGSTNDQVMAHVVTLDEYKAIEHEAARVFQGWAYLLDVNGTDEALENIDLHLNAEYAKDRITVKFGYLNAGSSHTTYEPLIYYVPAGSTNDDVKALIETHEKYNTITHAPGRGFTGWTYNSGVNGTDLVGNDTELVLNAEYANVKVDVHLWYRDETGGEQVEEIEVFVPVGSTASDVLSQVKTLDEYQTIKHNEKYGFTGWMDVGGTNLTDTVYEGTLTSWSAQYTNVKVVAHLWYLDENDGGQLSEFEVFVPAGLTMNDVIEQLKTTEEYQALKHNPERGFTGWTAVGGTNLTDIVYEGVAAIWNAEYANVKVGFEFNYYDANDEFMWTHIDVFVPVGSTYDEAVAQAMASEDSKAIAHNEDLGFTKWVYLASDMNGTETVADEAFINLYAEYANIFVYGYLGYWADDGMFYNQELTFYVKNGSTHNEAMADMLQTDEAKNIPHSAYAGFLNWELVDPDMAEQEVEAGDTVVIEAVYERHVHPTLEYHVESETRHQIDCTTCHEVLFAEHVYGEDDKCVCGYFEHEHQKIEAASFFGHGEVCTLCPIDWLVPHDISEGACPDCGRVPMTDVAVGGKVLTDGDYLDNAGNISREKPLGGYAYYHDGVLELNGFVYEGKGYLYDPFDSYYAGIYAERDLDIVLIGENKILGVGNLDAIASHASLYIQGPGSLYIRAEYGLYMYDGNLTIDDTTVSIEGEENATGIYVNGHFTMINANVTANADVYNGIYVMNGDLAIIESTVSASSEGADAICVSTGDVTIADSTVTVFNDSDADDGINVDGGNLNIFGSTVTCTVADDAIWVFGYEEEEGTVYIEDSKIKIKADSDGIRATHNYGDMGYGDIYILESTVEIEAENDGLDVDSDVVLENSKVTLVVGDNGIETDYGDVIMDGGVLKITAEDNGIYAEDDILIDLGAQIEITAKDHGLETVGDDIRIYDGSVTIKAENHGIYAYDYVEIYKGTVKIEAGDIGIVSETEDVEFEGGDTYIKARIGIYADETIDVYSGELKIEATEYAILAEYEEPLYVEEGVTTWLPEIPSVEQLEEDPMVDMEYDALYTIMRYTIITGQEIPVATELYISERPMLIMGSLQYLIQAVPNDRPFTYYGSANFLLDQNTESVTVNGETVENLETVLALDIEDGTEYVVVLTNGAGKRTRYEINLKPLSELDKIIDGLTIDNVTDEDREKLIQVADIIATYEMIGPTDGTEEELQYREETLERVFELLTALELPAQEIVTDTTDRIGYCGETLQARAVEAEGELYWQSSDPTVASVDPITGEITLHKAGEVIITVTAMATEECKAVAESYTLTVGHKYSTEWSFNDDTHWYACPCGAKSGEAKHNHDLNATYTEVQICDACGHAFGSYHNDIEDAIDDLGDALDSIGDAFGDIGAAFGEGVDAAEKVYDAVDDFVSAVDSVEKAASTVEVFFANIGKILENTIGSLIDSLTTTIENVVADCRKD